MSAELIAQGEHLVDLGRHEEARAIAQRLLSIAPEDVEALDLLVTACLPLGDRTALRAAQELVRLCPEDARPLTLAAQAAAAQSRTAEAHRYADAAIALEPDSAHVHHVRGYVDLVGFGSDAGVAAARTAVRLEPDDADHHRLLGALLLGRSRLDDAERSLQDALAIDPTHEAALDDLARLSLARSEPVAAASRFEHLLSLDPGDPRTAHNLMTALGRLVSTMHSILVVPALWFLVGPGGTSDTVVAYLGLVVVMATAVGMAKSLIRRMPVSGGRLFATTLRRDRLLFVLGLVVLASYAVLYVVPPAPERVVGGVTGFYCWLVLAGGIGLRVLRRLLGRGRSRPML